MSRRATDEGGSRIAPPLDGAGLERIALAYVGRYATTQAKLAAYLRRKLGERGWEGEGAPPTERLVARCAALGYVDDRQFATARAAALGRRGFGARRVEAALRAAGITGEDAAPARADADEAAWTTAVAFARRRRIGPFAEGQPDANGRRKAFAAMLRAGHDFEIARRLIDATADEDGNIEGYSE